MSRKYRLIDSRVVAIITTQVESNLVTINPKQYADPKYQVAILVECEEHDKPWESGVYHVLLLFHGLLFSLNECGDPDARDNQTFKFELMDEVSPQIERMLDLAINKAL